MCDRCADIDYPIGDPIWLPCGGPAARYTSRRRGISLPPLTPNRAQMDDAYEAHETFETMQAILRRQQAEIVTLKAALHRTDSRDSFEGVE